MLTRFTDMTRKAFSRFALCCVLVLTSWLPYAASSSAHAGQLSQYLCAPSQLTAQTSPASSREAEAAIAELFLAAGKPLTPDAPELAGAHCENCVLPFYLFAQPEALVSETAPAPSCHVVYASVSSAVPDFATGPPLGGRAPPAIL